MKNIFKTFMRFLIRLFVLILITAAAVFLGCIPSLLGCKEEWLTSSAIYASILLANLMIITFHIDKKVADMLLKPPTEIPKHVEQKITGLTSPISDAYYDYWSTVASKSYSLKRLQPERRTLRITIGMITMVSGFLFLLPFAFESLPQELFIISFTLMGGGIGIMLLGYFRGILTGLCGMALAAVIVMSGDRVDELIDSSTFAAILLLASLLFAIGFVMFLLVKKINRANFRLPVFEDSDYINIPVKNILTNNAMVCAVTISANTAIPNAEKHYIINKAADIAAYCRRKGITYAGVRATKYDPTVTYIAYCQNRVAAQKLRAHIESSVDGVIIETVIDIDPDYEIYRSLLPDEKTLFRAYNALFADMLENEKSKLKLTFGIFFPNGQTGADELIRSDSSLDFEFDGCNIATANVIGRFEISDINRFTDEFVTLAEQFDASLLPWIIEKADT